MLLHAIIFFGIINAFGIHNPYLITACAAFFFALWGGFVCAWFFILQKNTKFTSDLYLVTSVWLGTGHYLVWASLLYFLVEFLALGFSLPINPKLLGQIFYLIAFGVSVYGLNNSRSLFVKKYSVKINNLPEFWHGKKAVMFADAHLGNIHRLEYVQKIVNLVNVQKPDVVFIPGDFFDGPPADFKALAAPLADIRAPLGVYFCNGNHEEYADSRQYVSAIEQAGVKILNNAFVEIEGLQIVGVDYHSTIGGWNLKKVLNEITYDTFKPSILLKHVPSGLKAAESSGMALMLSGHTHKAQVWPLGFLTKLVFKGYDYGHKPYKHLQVITTSGAGTWGPPQRVGTQNEIVVVEMVGGGK